MIVLINYPRHHSLVKRRNENVWRTLQATIRISTCTCTRLWILHTVTTLLLQNGHFSIATQVGICWLTITTFNQLTSLYIDSYVEWAFSVTLHAGRKTIIVVSSLFNRPDLRDEWSWLLVSFQQSKDLAKQARLPGDIVGTVYLIQQNLSTLSNILQFHHEIFCLPEGSWILIVWQMTH